MVEAVDACSLDIALAEVKLTRSNTYFIALQLMVQTGSQLKAASSKYRTDVAGASETPSFKKGDFAIPVDFSEELRLDAIVLVVEVFASDDEHQSKVSRCVCVYPLFVFTCTFCDARQLWWDIATSRCPTT
jgi:hypothetical protein